MSTEDRRVVIALIDEAIESGARQFRACTVINLDERRLRNWRKTESDGRIGGYRSEDQALTEAEKDLIIEAVDTDEMKELPAKQIHLRLMDRGIYVSSYSAFRRVLKERNMPQVKRHAAKTNRKRPELAATEPNQIWCWDITWLESRTKGRYLYLYMIIDMFSRKVVGWDVAAQENGPLAKALFARTLEAEGVSEHQLIVHSDNGKPMRSRTLRALYTLLKVTASYGRPHTSNDNAFAESLFATFKGRVAFPEYFRTIEAARAFCAEFFQWYNDEHRHSGLDYVTPSQVHTGAHLDIFARRNALLEQHRLQHPKRHGGQPKIYGLPDIVRLKHRVPEVDTITINTDQRMKSIKAAKGQTRNYDHHTAGRGCRQEPSINLGSCTLDGSSQRQYVKSSSTLAVEC